MARASKYLLVLATLMLGTTTLQSCPFCEVQGKTLTQEVSQAAFVVYGKLANARFGGGAEAGQTDLVIESVVKDHPYLKNRKTLTLERYIPIEKNKEQRLMVFCDLYKGKLDAYRGQALSVDSDMGAYLKGALKVKDSKPTDRLKFFFDFLDNSEFAISNDAFMEFGYAEYKDYKDLAVKLPPDRIVKWLKSPKLRPYRIGLYASMLGHCSKNHSRDLGVLRALIEDPDSPTTTGADGVLAAMVMIDSKKGWEYITKILTDVDKPFTRRYAALRSVRFLFDFRKDLVKKAMLIDGFGSLLPQADIADLAIEDLRKRKCWGKTEEILALSKKSSHDIPIIRRSIIRYALSSPDPLAKAFVEKQRKADAELVSDQEELLKLEQSVPADSAQK